MNVLVVEPMKKPYMKDIDSGLHSLQKEVGGYIEAIYPYEDLVGLVCNEEGKWKGYRSTAPSTAKAVRCSISSPEPSSSWD